MSQIATISEFLLQAGTDYRVFDMGRSIRKISSQQFLDIENGLSKPQFPRAQHIWLGIVFWNKALSQQHYIWFVKLPLDEQGLVIPASRNHFLSIIIDALGQQLEQAESKNAQLPENPYSFLPNQHQLADFTSISKSQLNLGQSDYYDIASAYIKLPSAIKWQDVPIQGIADFASLYGQVKTEAVLVEQFESLDEPVKFALLTSLENQPVGIKFAEVIQTYLLSNPQHSIIWQHGLRALCQSSCNGLVVKLIHCTLNTELAKEQNLLAVISGRLWHHMVNADLLNAYMHKVAIADPSSVLFASIYRDLVQIPGLRSHLLAMLRSPDKSVELTSAIGKLFSGQ